MKGRGLFITLEGGEGVGKSTNLAFLETTLQAHGIRLDVTREPGGTPLAESLRELLLAVREEDVAASAELLMIFAARAQHLHQRIEPALASGTWVLCDRFTDATYAYQCGGRGLDNEIVAQLEQLVQGELRPDCTILLDAPVETGLDRARGRGDLDRIEQENLAFFERVRSTYLALASESSGRYRVVDAARPLEDIQSELSDICSDLVECWEVRTDS